MLQTETITHARVRAYESTLQLPTYEIRGQNPNPVFHSQYGVAHIYPYTLLDDIAPTAQPHIYRTLNLENQYLRVTVLPELGGRVYSLFDKLSNCEVFYKNPVIKFAPLAIRGAFFSGGLEFSFPVAHQPATADPVNWDMRENEDGSATLAFGGLEHMSRMRWTISLTLYPNRCALAQDVQLQNPSLVSGRFHYWTNASLPADDGTEFIYPLRRFRSYEFAGTASWSYARLDTILQDAGLPGMEGVPSWTAGQLHAPIELRWQKNMLAQVSIFGRDVKWDFFGAWRHHPDVGYAHFADHRDVSGMKLWSWGNAAAGVMNQAALTDDGAVYAETQCGAMETQLDFDFLAPGAVRAWREWWLPLRGMGGLTCASESVAARIQVQAGTSPENYAVTVCICPALMLPKALVTLATPLATLLQTRADLTPERAWTQTTSVPGSQIGAYPLIIHIEDAAGATLLHHTLDRDVSQVEPFEPQQAQRAVTAQEWFEQGLRAENFDNRTEALEAYDKAIKLESNNGPAHLRLGLMLLRAARFDTAEAHLKHAAQAGQNDANYYLGVLYLYLDQLKTAESAFQQVPNTSSLCSAARMGLGRIALREGAPTLAASWFSEAASENPASLTAHALLGVAECQEGNLEGAQAEFEFVLQRDPLNLPALHEAAQFSDTTPKAVQDKLERILADDPQYWLDLACFYAEAGLLDKAVAVISGAARDSSDGMLRYLAADWQARLGHTAEAERWRTRAVRAQPEFLFPSRLEEVLALEHALQAKPDDQLAQYALGNFYYAHERYEEAIALWESASARMSSFDVLWRNLGLAYWQQRNNLPRATECLERALALNPLNQDVYALLNKLYMTQAQVEKRRALLEQLQMLPNPRDDVHKLIVFMLVDLGEYEQAIRMLQTEQFVASEMDQSFRTAYTSAFLQRARAHQREGQREAAIHALRLALDYPANVGVGRPLTPNDAEILYELGCTLEESGKLMEAIEAWRQAAYEYHPHGSALFPFVQHALDKLSRYSEIGLA